MKVSFFFFFLLRRYVDYSFQNEKFDYVILNLKTNRFRVVEIGQESEKKIIYAM